MPDLVLLDINLPDVNGFEVSRRLKDDPVTGHIPVVLLTASYDVAAATEIAARLGAVSCLASPIAAKDLVTILNLILRKHGLQQKTRAAKQSA